MEQRIEDLETKLTYQEATLDTLNKVVTRQQQQLDRLEAICQELLERLHMMSDDGLASVLNEEERPPHY